MPILTRRQFLQGTGTTALSTTLSLGLAPLAIPLWQPNNEIRIACVGLRGRGGDHLNGFSRIKGVRIVAIVDVDADVLAEAKQKLADGKYGDKNEVDTYTDLRRVLTLIKEAGVSQPYRT